MKVPLTRTTTKEPVSARQHRLAAGWKTDFSDSENVLYTAPIYVGTPLQGSASNEYIFDTTFRFVAIPSSSCTTCSDAIYNEADSTSAVDGGAAVSTAYDFGIISGTSVLDTVCLSLTETTSCADSLDFIDMTSPAETMSEFDGVLGLAPPADDDSKKSFINQLVATQGYDKIVSFNLLGDEPYIYFGEPSEDFTPSDSNFLDNTSSVADLWEVTTTSVMLGNTAITSANE